jgi:LmbE family N-acetylglucosaminyl deacetylase
MLNSTSRMLVISPHPDDCILGAGGTMMRFVKAGGEVTVLTVAVQQPSLYPEELFHRIIEEAKTAHSMIGVKESIFLNRPTLSLGEMPHVELNQRIGDCVDKVRPAIVLIPYFDRHIDHRACFDSAMVACRPIGSGCGIELVAAYEVLSSTHYNAPHLEPNFTPNWIVDVSDCIDTKIEAVKCCSSQIDEMPHRRSAEAARALALFRGSQAGVAFGEGFHILRMQAPPEAFS